MGLIASSWGGTPIQAWTPAEGFSSEEAALLRDEVGNKPRFPSMPSVLYNGMIAPIAGFGMRGAIWYQGEADNSPKAAPKYGHRMETMVDLWRDNWNEGAFPFYFVQIAPWNGYKPADTLPIIWEQQEWFAHHGKNTGMAATGDIGDLKNIHPKNKHEVGRRLALIALANTYGFKDITYEGPVYRHIKIEGNQIRVHFNHAHGLKTLDGQPPRSFEIAGADGHFVPANVTIDDDDALVSSPEVSTPEFVRMGWHQDSTINLCNAADLPATPFESEK
jgi:sialate O-acetylesterase